MSLKDAAPIARKLKPYLSVAIVALTIGLFIYYIATHPQSVKQLTNTNPLLLATLLALYGLMILCLAAVYGVAIKLSGKNIGRRENVLLTFYSSIVNFFGPLQSGPGFRAAYLKKRHDVSIRTYTAATIVYYAFYGFFSALALFAGGEIWWAAGLMILGMILFLAVILPRYAAKLRFSPVLVGLMAVATLGQVVIFGIIYWLELWSINPQVSLGQALAYTGTANLSLFASLTPGAIGIREAFLLFTQSLHHVDQAAIVTASVLDRGVYVVFLGLLFVMAVSLHTKDRLQLSGWFSK